MNPLRHRERKGLEPLRLRVDACAGSGVAAGGYFRVEAAYWMACAVVLHALAELFAFFPPTAYIMVKF
jgi:hypothetical protein